VSSINFDAISVLGYRIKNGVKSTRFMSHLLPIFHTKRNKQKHLGVLMGVTQSTIQNNPFNINALKA